MWTHPGKKLLFMGDEFGQRQEWSHESALDWPLSSQPEHAAIRRWVSDLNALYRIEPALYEVDFETAGFAWVDCRDRDASVLAYLRRSRAGTPLLVVCNFTPIVRSNYTVGVPQAGSWREVLNSDAQPYGGSGAGNFGAVVAAPVPAHGYTHALSLTLPPLGALLLKPAGGEGRRR
jgi:1,4-alpha-glucan branching enzyme